MHCALTAGWLPDQHTTNREYTDYNPIWEALGALLTVEVDPTLFQLVDYYQ